MKKKIIKPYGEINSSDIGENEVIKLDFIDEPYLAKEGSSLIEESKQGLRLIRKPDCVQIEASTFAEVVRWATHYWIKLTIRGAKVCSFQGNLKTEYWSEPVPKKYDELIINITRKAVKKDLKNLVETNQMYSNFTGLPSQNKISLGDTINKFDSMKEALDMAYDFYTNHIDGSIKLHAFASPDPINSREDLYKYYEEELQ